MNITPAGLQLLFQHIELKFQQAYIAAQTTYQEWTSEIMSSTREEHYGWMDRIAMVREWLGERALQNAVAQEYTLKNRKWELSLAIKREDLEDEQAAVFSMGPQFMGEQAKVHPDILAAQVLEAGTGVNTFDSTTFFSTSHPVDTANAAKQTPEGSTTQANVFSTAAGNGTTPLTPANILTMKKNMRKFSGRDGHRLGVNPTHLMVPPALEQQALQVCNMTYIAPSSFGVNTAAAMQENVLKGQLKPIINERLTSDTAWYLLDLSKPIKPLVFQKRMAPEFTMMVNPSDPNVWNLDQYEYGVRARYNVGYTLWFLALKADV